MAKPWTNADGLQVPFGNYWNDPTNFVNKSRAVNTLGAVKQIEIDVDLTRLSVGVVSYSADLNNDGTVDGFHDGDVRLPANASITQAVLVMKTAAASGGAATLIVGTFKKDGTAIDADGIVTLTEGVVANMNAIGKRVYGAGAHVSATAGTAGVGTSNAYIGLTVGTAAFTAGTARLIIEYIDPNAEAVAD